MNRSILKPNYSRQILKSTSQTKLGKGIFKKSSSFEAKSTSNDEELPVCIRETRSASVTQHTDHYKGIIRKKSPDKLAKKVQFLEVTANSDETVKQRNPFARLIDCEAEYLDFHNLIESVNDSDLAQIGIDDETDLLSLLSVIPPDTTDSQERYFRAKNSFISKMTSTELIVVVVLIFMFFIMILKHFRCDWLSPSKSVPQLTGSEILSLMGKNIKRLCKTMVPRESYF